MTEPVSLIDRRLARIRHLVAEATGSAEDVLAEVDAIGRAMDGVSASLSAIRSDLDNAILQVGALLKTPELSDEKRAAIELVAQTCDEMRLEVEAMAEGISAELQSRAYGISDGP